MLIPTSTIAVTAFGLRPVGRVPRAEYLELIPRDVSQQTLGDLAARGNAGTEEENSLTCSRCHLSFPSARFLRIPRRPSPGQRHLHRTAPTSTKFGREPLFFDFRFQTTCGATSPPW